MSDYDVVPNDGTPEPARVPLCSLQMGDKFRLTPGGGVIEVRYHSTNLSSTPEGQLMVIPVAR
jgi:hypothetical protein